MTLNTILIRYTQCIYEEETNVQINMSAHGYCYSGIIYRMRLKDNNLNNKVSAEYQSHSVLNSSTVSPSLHQLLIGSGDLLL